MYLLTDMNSFSNVYNRCLLVLADAFEFLIPRYLSKCRDVGKLSFLNTPRSVLISLSTLIFGGNLLNQAVKSLSPPLASMFLNLQSGRSSDSLYSLPRIGSLERCRVTPVHELIGLRGCLLDISLRGGYVTALAFST